MALRRLVLSVHNSAKKKRFRIISITAYLLVSIPITAHASIVSTTVTGTMRSGTDIYGVLGFPQGTNLVGKTYTLVYMFDDTKGIQDIIEIASGTCDQSISSSSLSNPGTALLTIAGGAPYPIGSTSPPTTSSAKMGAGGCQTKPTDYITFNLGVTVSTSRISTAVTTPTNSQFYGDTSWEYSFTGTPQDGSGDLLVYNASGQEAAIGQMTVTDITVSSNASAPASSGLQFVPLTPCRVADTRGAAGPFGSPSLTAASTREFDIPQGACATPNAVAYSLNVTAIPKGALGYLTIWPSGQAQPAVSTLNSDGRVKANAAIVPAGSNGGVSVYVTDPADVVLDINGYFVPAGNSAGLGYYALTPCRIVDTRGGSDVNQGPSLDARSTREFPIMASSCNIPADAQLYSLNLTAIPKGGPLGYLTIWPTGITQPVVSTLNATTGAVTANAAIVSAGTHGNVSVFVSDKTDLLIDVNGYFAAPSANGLSLYPTTPCRVLDTRSGSGALNGMLGIAVEGSTCAPPASARAYVLNSTVVPAGPLGYLTLWPSGETQPTVSTLNAGDGAVTSNMAIAPTINGGLNAFSTSSTQLILDISSYFAP